MSRPRGGGALLRGSALQRGFALRRRPALISRLLQWNLPLPWMLHPTAPGTHVAGHSAAKLPLHAVAGIAGELDDTCHL